MAPPVEVAEKTQVAVSGVSDQNEGTDTTSESAAAGSEVKSSSMTYIYGERLV